MEVNNVGRMEKIIHKIQAVKKVKEIEEQQQSHGVEKQGQQEEEKVPIWGRTKKRKNLTSTLQRRKEGLSCSRIRNYWKGEFIEIGHH